MQQRRASVYLFVCVEKGNKKDAKGEEEVVMKKGSSTSAAAAAAGCRRVILYRCRHHRHRHERSTQLDSTRLGSLVIISYWFFSRSRRRPSFSLPSLLSPLRFYTVAAAAAAVTVERDNCPQTVITSSSSSSLAIAGVYTVYAATSATTAVIPTGTDTRTTG